MVEKTVTRPQQLAGLDRAAPGAHGDALAIADFQGRAVLEDPHAKAGQGGGFAQQQVQRMHMPAAHMQQGAAVGVGADDLLDIGAAEKADFMLAVDRLEVFFPGPQGLFLTGVEAHIAVAMAEIGVDVVLGDPVFDDVGAQVTDLEHLAQAVFADVLLDFLQVVADAGHDLPAIAPGAAKAQVAGLEHDDVGDALFGQLQRRVDAGKPATDDDHVRVFIVFQGREAQVVFLGCRVVGRRFDRDHGAA